MEQCHLFIGWIIGWKVALEWQTEHMDSLAFLPFLHPAHRATGLPLSVNCTVQQSPLLYIFIFYTHVMILFFLLHIAVGKV